MSDPAAEAFAAVEYDFLIVGSGTAGLVLAARLSENPNVTVGVIEAGADTSSMPEVNVPGMIGQAFADPRLDWGFKTAPQRDINGREIAYIRGKGLGGSSANNFLCYSRASAEEYNAIEALGNPGWNWAEFLKYMKKAECFTEPPAETKERYYIGDVAADHGSDGPLKISYSHWFNELHRTFMHSQVNLGVPVKPNAAYYKPVAHRNNLVVLLEAQFTCVLLEPSDTGYKAVGVKFVKDSQEYTAKTKREVILCAGSFQSPQLLELSGIGLKGVLNKHGIKQYIDLPVGENLLDRSIETLDNCLDPEFLNTQLKKYQEERRGMLAGTFSAFSYVPTDQFMDPDVRTKFLKDLESDAILLDSDAHTRQYKFLKKWFANSNSAALEILQFPVFYSTGNPARKDDLKARYQTTMLINLHPLSRGTVHIASADRLAPPRIEANFLSNERDVDVLVSGIRFAQKLLKTAPYTEAKPTYYDPTAEVLEDDKKLRDWLRDRVLPIFHPVGMCSILPKADGGVVSPELLVYGMTNLRVIDASILLLQLSSHIQSAVYALAEKAADIIKQMYQLA